MKCGFLFSWILLAGLPWAVAAPDTPVLTFAVEDYPPFEYEEDGEAKGINVEVLIKALEEALRSAAKKKFGNQVDIDFTVDRDRIAQMAEDYDAVLVAAGAIRRYTLKAVPPAATP